MWKNYQDHLEIGTIYVTLFPETLKDEESILPAIDLLIRDIFFDRIELGYIQDKVIRDELKRRLKISRIKTTYVAQPRIFGMDLNLNSLDERKREEALIQLKKCMEEALEMGSDSMAFCSGPWVNEQKEEAKAALVSSIIELDAYAKELNLKLFLEVYDFNVERNRLLGTTIDTLAVAKSLEDKVTNFSLMIDLSHIPLLRETIQESVLPLQGKIGHVHIGNGVINQEDPRYGDRHPYFGYPNGSNDVKEVAEFLKALADIGYLKQNGKASLSIEIIKGDGERAEDLVMNAKRTLKEAWYLFANMF
ncbi:MAG: hypothetical protein VR72_15615 [Clostridiaceae bacterium BRH_c20a]|nr:MAG: hypothetical protein VR72_15615 [Clostridiaceae bacterium BRH_c20a]